VKTLKTYSIFDLSFLKGIIDYYTSLSRQKKYIFIFFNKEIPCIINNIDCSLLREQYENEYNALKKQKACLTCVVVQLKHKYIQKLLNLLNIDSK
jgi:hypothetical protein